MLLLSVFWNAHIYFRIFSMHLQHGNTQIHAMYHGKHSCQLLRWKDYNYFVLKRIFHLTKWYCCCENDIVRCKNQNLNLVWSISISPFFSSKFACCNRSFTIDIEGYRSIKHNLVNRIYLIFCANNFNLLFCLHFCSSLSGASNDTDNYIAISFPYLWRNIEALT